MRPRFPFLATVTASVAFLILVGLGTWQLERLRWKEDLIARVQARTAETPVPLPEVPAWEDLDLVDWEYRPVEVRGRFHHALEARVYTLLSDPHGPLSGPGYWIMTPLEVSGSSASVFVNRGFVPAQEAGDVPRPEGEVTVRGLLRAPEGRNLFTPDDEPARKIFYARDPAALAAGLGVSSAAPFTIDASETPPGGLPQAGETRLDFPNRHLEYALTWYGLAGALAAVFAAFLSRRLHQRDGSEA